MAEPIDNGSVLYGTHRGAIIVFRDNTYLDISVVERGPPILKERWDHKIGKFVKKTPEEIEKEARRRGANIVAERTKTGARTLGSYELFKIEPRDFQSKLKQLEPEQPPKPKKQPPQETAAPQTIYWGSYGFDPTKSLGQRFVVALSNPTRNLPRNSLEQLGELQLSRREGYRKVRYSPDEVAAYAQIKFGNNVIIVPTDEKRADRPAFRFYQEPKS